MHPRLSLVLITALVTCACGAGSATPKPSTTTPASAATKRPPTAVAKTPTPSDPVTSAPTETPAATPSVATTDPLVGTWATPATTCAEQNAALEAAGFSAEQLGLGGWDATCGDMNNGSQFTVRFEDGVLAVFLDDSQEWEGEYRIVDDSTFEARDQASADWYLRYEYEISSDQLTIDMVADDYPAESEAELLGEQIAQTVIYESAAFSRQDYTTTSFAAPLTLTLDPLLDRASLVDTSNLLTWNAAASANDRVRFLLPVVVYAPGNSVPEPPPADYLSYLRSQATDGAAFSDISTITVDGQPATFMTATTTVSIAGSLGCPDVNWTADECFGLQPEFMLRGAFIELEGGSPLMAWARTDSEAPNEEFLAMFERILGTVEFK